MPPAPYRIGHIIQCVMQLGDAEVTYRVEIPDNKKIIADPTKPVVDTDQGEIMMRAQDPASAPDCGTPRVRQMDIGAKLTCRTAAGPRNFTVNPDKGATHIRLC